ncbi:unnamed protein product, partial [Linum tenue]
MADDGRSGDVIVEMTAAIPTPPASDQAATRRKGVCRTVRITEKPSRIQTLWLVCAVNEMAEKASSSVILAGMPLFLMQQFLIKFDQTATILFFWNAASSFTPIIGALASDCIGRFRVIATSSLAAILGIVVITLTTTRGLQLRPCNLYLDLPPGECDTGPMTWQLIVLSVSISLFCIGSGGVRSCSSAFAVDQLKKEDDDPVSSQRTLEKLNGWYQTAVGAAVMILVFLMGQIINWGARYLILTILMVVSAMIFVSGSYVHVTDDHSLVKVVARIIYVAWKKRRHSISIPSNRWFHHNKPRRRPILTVCPSQRLSFLNKACLIVDQEEVNSSTGLPREEWNLCSVQEVEELKALVNTIPICSTMIIVTVANTAGPFPTAQANLMDTRLLGGLTIPVLAYGAVSVASMAIWVTGYNHLLVPCIAKLSSNRIPNGIPSRYRMGMGILTCCLGNFIAGWVEHRRRVYGTENMSANLLIPQLCLAGLTEALFGLGLLDFLNARFPSGCTGDLVSSMGQCLGSLAGAALFAAVKRFTRVATSTAATSTGFGEDSSSSWVGDDANSSKYDRYYWLLAALSLLNFIYYLICCLKYKDIPVPVAETTAEDQVQVTVEADQESNSTSESVAESKAEEEATAEADKESNSASAESKAEEATTEANKESGSTSDAIVEPKTEEATAETLVQATTEANEESGSTSDAIIEPKTEEATVETQVQATNEAKKTSDSTSEGMNVGWLEEGVACRKESEQA